MFRFVAENLNCIYLIITVLVFLEGLSVLVFPHRVTRAFERRLTLINLRIYGGIIIALGVFLLWFYLSTLRYLFTVVR